MVPAGWQRKWSRLTKMAWSELYTRANQELSKRCDLTLHRLGLSPSIPSIRVHGTSRPNFLFDEQPKQRAQIICKYLPDQTEKILREASNICHHRFDLLGYENLQYGSEIGWHSDPVHEKHCPVVPWFKIDFLNFSEVGDHKIIWELNRHQHLVTLAKAWLLTDNAAYTQELVRQWYSWQRANPYPLGINWASSLEVAFRSLSWLWVLHLADNCAEFTHSFKSDLRSALCLNGRHIEKYLSTYFSPNTHFLGEAVALFFIGTLRPEISTARRWQTKGWKILLEESQRQVRPDGVYFEQSLYYHVYALDFFLHARRLAEMNGISIPNRFDETLRKMLDVVHSLSETRTLEGFGDDDGGRVFDPRRNQIDHLTDPLMLGAVTYNCNKYSTFGLTEEAIWLFGDKAVQMLKSSPTHPDQTESKAFKSGGIYLMNDRNLTIQQLIIDAGPQGTARSGHGHADALSACLMLEGRRVLIDAGTAHYLPEEERNLFRGTGAHNTLRVDNLDQAVPAGPFAWNSIPNTTADVWLNRQTFDFFSGTQDGYCRLPDPVLHRRSVFHVKGGLWLIQDAAEGKEDHRLEIFWHFAPDVMVTQQSGSALIKPENKDQKPTNTTLAMLWDANSPWTSRVMDSFVSPGYGRKQAATALCLSIEGCLPQTFGIMLLPFPTELGTFTSAHGEKVNGYRYQTTNCAELIFFSTHHSWTCGKWSSDARLLYCKLQDNRLAHVIMVDGSFAEWRGHRFISRPERCPSFEWMKSSLSPSHPQHTDDSTESTTVVELDFRDAAL